MHVLHTLRGVVTSPEVPLSASREAARIVRWLAPQLAAGVCKHIMYGEETLVEKSYVCKSMANNVSMDAKYVVPSL